MLVFITHPKYFDIKSLDDKKVDLIYIFNSKVLYHKLSKDYKCINIGKDGNIVDENYFPKQTLKKYYGLLEFKKGIYGYFKKKHYKAQSKIYVMRGGYKDVMYRMTFAEVRRLEKKNINEAILYLDNAILKEVISMLEFEYSKKWTEIHNDKLKYIFNLINSFYRAYIYRFFRKRGLELFGDLFRHNLFLNILIHYPFEKYDIYENRFHYNYLKVISRLFIEQLHKNDVKGFIKSNIAYYKENGWL